MNIFFSILSTLLLLSCTSTGSSFPELETVPNVVLERYLGTWFEIASYPQRFQKDCVYTKANYSLRSDGDIKVLNQCNDKVPTGKMRIAEGKAWIVDKNTQAKLKVQFFWPFSGDYWIIELGKNYEYAVVGHPDRDYLWILSRTPQMEENVYQGILDRLKKVHHYDLVPLKKTLQP